MSGAIRASALAAAAFAATSPAAAREPAARDESITLVSPGYLFSTMAGPVPVRGHGVELSVVHIPNVTKYAGFGVVGQLQSYGGSHLRTALAAEVVYELLGLELGWALRRSDGAHPAQHGLHVAPYVSLGIVSFAWRTTLPIDDRDGGYGWETGFALAVKLPVPVRNWENLGYFSPGLGNISAGGRPLRDEDGVALLPDVLEGRTRGASPADRVRWIRDARLEHASIESFLWLADDLDALGAPSELVARAVRAAEEERRHAALCLAYAGSGVRLRSRVHPRRRRARPSLAKLAREAWIDGVLGEGGAARALAREAQRTPDPERARALLGVASEEASHARLSADVLGWLASR